MARVAPQMNVFVIGLPIQVAVGFTMMIIALPLLATVGPRSSKTSPVRWTR